MSNLNTNDDGQWEVIPQEENIVLNTADKYVDRDIIIIGGVKLPNIVNDRYLHTNATNGQLEWAEVQGSNNAQVIVTITPAASATVNLTNQQSGKVFSQETNALGIAILNITEFGLFNVSYRSAGAISSQRTINITQPGETYEISATYTTSKTYTAIVDLNNSNPQTCITYADDAVGMSKGSNNWDDEIIFKDINPCVFANGEVVYYLNKQDMTQKADGTPANLDGTDGDVMIEFPKFAYRIYKDEDKHMYVSITNDPAVVDDDSRYHYYAFSKEEEGDRDYFYWGAFKGSMNTTNGLQSVAGLAPAVSKTIGAFKTCAQNRGSGYTITSYYQLVALQCLYIIKYGNLNGQAALGQGISERSNTSSDANYGPLPTGGTTTFAAGRKMYYGDPSNTGSSADYDTAKLGHVKFAGIEDFWGNIWEWIDGLTTDASCNIVTNWDYNHSTEQEDFIFTTGLTSNKSGWVGDVAGTTETGFMNTVWNGSSSTYFCDYGYLYSGCVLYFGGRWNNGATCGPFYLYAAYGASIASASLGARLMYL